MEKVEWRGKELKPDDVAYRLLIQDIKERDLPLYAATSEFDNIFYVGYKRKLITPEQYKGYVQRFKKEKIRKTPKTEDPSASWPSKLQKSFEQRLRRKPTKEEAKANRSLTKSFKKLEPNHEVLAALKRHGKPRVPYTPAMEYSKKGRALVLEAMLRNKHKEVKRTANSGQIYCIVTDYFSRRIHWDKPEWKQDDSRISLDEFDDVKNLYKKRWPEEYREGNDKQFQEKAEQDQERENKRQFSQKKLAHNEMRRMVWDNLRAGNEVTMSKSAKIVADKYPTISKQSLRTTGNREKKDWKSRKQIL